MQNVLSNRRTLAATFAAAVLGLMVALPASAQPAPAPGGAGGANPGNQGDRQGGRGGRGNAEDFRQRYETRMKELMAVNDDEWKVLQPRIEKVQQLQRATSAGRGAFAMFGGPGGGPGGRGDRGDRGGAAGGAGSTGATTSYPVAERARDLQTALQNKDASADEIKAKLAAFREAREKAEADLTAAQTELRELLTARQESVLVVMGVLK